MDWPPPKNVRGLHGFLGLTGYYRRFISNYGTLARPLTDLLKKNSFEWTIEAGSTFEALKRVMSSPPVLALPDFKQTFYVECDASGTRVGAVLTQQGRPLAYFSRGLKGKSTFLSAYEKELLALVIAVRKWRPCLLGRRFVVKTDKHSLKYLMEQKIGTPMQQQWVSKLFGYDFTIEYRSGQSNTIADALSRKDAEILAVTLPIPSWIEELRREHASDPSIQALHAQLQQGLLDPARYTEHDGVLFYKGRFYLSPQSPFREKVLKQMHDSPIGGHSGYHKTYHRIKKDFFWVKMRMDIRAHIRQCDPCHHNKGENIHPAGLLQPLDIPTLPSTSLSMDFIEGLSAFCGQNTIMVVVDRLSKYAHFLALSHPYTASSVARLFTDTVFKLHGMPTSIVSDRDPIFLSLF